MAVSRIAAAGMLVLLLAGSLHAAVKLRMVEGRPLIDGVFVNGHGPYRFLLDTGTTLNHLDPDIARSIGLEPSFRKELVSAAGTAYAAGAGGVEVAIGDAQATGQSFLFAGLEIIHRRFPDVQGVLGQEFLSRFDYFLDLRGKRIEFGKRETPGTTRVPFEIITGRPVILTNLGALVLDSGAHSITLFNVKAGEESGELITMAGSARVGSVLSKLTIDGRTFWRGEALTVPQSAESGTTGLLPLHMFKSVYVCNSERYVALN